jgi:hypothetical protein
VGFLAWFGDNWKHDRLHEEPSIGELVVSNNGIAVGTFRARSAEALKYFVGWGGSVQGFPLLRVDGEPRARDLHDVVGANGDAVVGGNAKFYAALRAVEPLTQAIETVDHGKRRSLALSSLLDCCSSRCRMGVRFACSRVFGSPFGTRVAPGEDKADKQDASGARHAPTPNLLLHFTDEHVCLSSIAPCI